MSGSGNEDHVHVADVVQFLGAALSHRDDAEADVFLAGNLRPRNGKGTFDQRINSDPNLLQEPVSAPEDVAELKQLIEAHAKYTGSKRATRMLNEWDATLPRFVKHSSAEMCVAGPSVDP